MFQISVFLAAAIAASMQTAIAWQVHAPAQEREPAWAAFRGSDSTGRYSFGDPLPSELNLGSSLQWKVGVPEGHSSPIVVGELIVITGYEDKQLVVMAIDRRTGVARWKQQIPVEAMEKIYHHGPATPTATSDGSMLFVVFGSVGVLAYDLNGREWWRHSWKTVDNLYGTAASPIVVDDKLIVLSSDQRRGVVRAYNKADGSVAWERLAAGPASTWATPVAVRRPDDDLILIYEPFHLRAIRLSDGNEVWAVPGLADEPITTPQLTDNLVIVTSYNMGTNREVIGIPSFDAILDECDTNDDRQLDRSETLANRSVLSRPDADGEGDHPLRMFFKMMDENKDDQIQESEWPRLQAWVDSFKHANGFIALRLIDNEAPAVQWRQKKGVPECPTPVCVDGLMFAVRNGGILTSIDTELGEVLFHERAIAGGPYYASPVAGDGKLYFASARGQLTAVSASAIPRVLSTVDLGEPIWATPALARGTVIVRSKSTLWAFGRPAVGSS
jgi:outer membrane protein assembly factor BamB